jgi:hypothetical protein
MQMAFRLVVSFALSGERPVIFLGKLIAQKLCALPWHSAKRHFDMRIDCDAT